MGLFFDIYLSISSAVDSVVYNIKSAVKTVKDFFGRVNYEDNNVASTIDVERALAEFRDSIQPDVERKEDECMDKLVLIYDELNNLVEDVFPDLSDMIEIEKENARFRLSGMIMKYVKEHLSENDDRILNVLKMPPGTERANEMEKQIDRVLKNAEKHFNKNLKKNTINISDEVNKRLSMRLSDQDKYMEMKISRLEQLEKDIKMDSVNVELIVNEISPQLEAAQCTISVLQTDF